MHTANSAPEAVATVFPFVLPWDDASPSVTNISHWLHKPAGKFGHIRVSADGHLYAGKQRIRFFWCQPLLRCMFPTKGRLRENRCPHG